MPDAEATPADSPEQVEETPTPSEPKEPDCSSDPPPGDCDPGLADLTCTAAGDKAKTDYTATFAKDLEDAAKDYQTTRTAYRDARHEQRQVVEDLCNQIRHLVERIGCQIVQKRVRTCLDDSFKDVLKELGCCPDPVLCCPENCEFPIDQVDPHDVTALSALITEYEARIDEAKACFAALKGEPEALAKRVTDLKKAVADINAELGGDAAKLDLKKAYAEALVAQWRAGLVWAGFRQVQDFVDCLCQALTCWTKGCEAVYQLRGLRAVAECVDKRNQDRCDLLRTETVEQILAGYDRRCGKRDCDRPPEGEPKPKDCEDDCQERQHHRRGCGCHCGCGCGCHGNQSDA
jgi:hypothetical protein